MPVNPGGYGSSMGVAVVVLAAGEGARVGAGRNKALLPVAGEPLFVHSLRTASQLDGLARLVLVVRSADRPDFESALASTGIDAEVVGGGETRHDSEWRALGVLADDIESGIVDVVAIHDAARPLAPAWLFTDVIAVARESGGAIPGRHQTAMIRRSDLGSVGPVIAVQTPQAFRAPELLDAYRRAERDGFTGTDTASCLEAYADLPVGWVESPRANLKITYAGDLSRAERLIAVNAPARPSSP
jgi:2-C-methyl-D-erythritol 4-phosphate cytidylyltransferase